MRKSKKIEQQHQRLVGMYSRLIIVEFQVGIGHCTLSFFRVAMFFSCKYSKFKLILHRWQQSSGGLATTNSLVNVAMA